MKRTKEEKMEIAEKIKEYAQSLKCNVDIRGEELRIWIGDYE